MNLVNLTPHEITVITDDGKEIKIPPSGRIARILTKDEKVGEVNGISMYETKLVEVQDLPEPMPNTLFIVSVVVAEKVRRSDVLAPYSLVRDENGTVKGCRGLCRII